MLSSVLPLSHLSQPQYIRRPRQILRRLLRTVQVPTPTTVRLPWGSTLRVDPCEAIGNAIWRAGVYDLCVTETISRLLSPGGVGVDVGAHIGYITTLMQRKLGTAGQVYAFEPHPALVSILNSNLDPKGAPVKIIEAGASSSRGTVPFAVPAVISGSHVAEPIGRPAEETLSIRTTTLDAVLPDDDIDVLKLDVEGHERQVLEGGRRLLNQDRINTIVFEDHLGFESDVVALLRGHGYEVRRIFPDSSGLHLCAEEDPFPSSDEIRLPPNYVATHSPQVWSRLTLPGWEALQG